MRKILGFILENAGLNKKSVIADLGAGSGDYERWLKNRVKRIDAVELSDEIVRAMKREFGKSNVRVIRADIRKTGLGSGRYDVVLMILALHHIRDAERALEEVSRIMKPGGRFILADMFTKNEILNRLYDFIDARGRRFRGGHGHYYRKRGALEQMIKKHFAIKKIAECPYKGIRHFVAGRALYCLGKG
jgi:ubiquinone/menaquinone biosynthesis C-methylase UbiE